MFIHRDKLMDESFGLCVNDTVKFEVSLTVVKKWISRTEAGLQVRSYQPSLHWIPGKSGKSDEVKCICEQAVGPAPILPMGPSLPSDMMQLYSERELHSDLTIIVQGERLHAHRAILLARSSYFRAMLATSGMAESSSDEVTLHETDPQAFKQYLRFVYELEPALPWQPLTPAHEHSCARHVLCVARHSHVCMTSLVSRLQLH
eukprot:SAG11_NODE_309_length_10941_cov_5.580520_3_plen_203_part_00